MFSKAIQEYHNNGQIVIPVVFKSLYVKDNKLKKDFTTVGGWPSWTLDKSKQTSFNGANGLGLLCGERSGLLVIDVDNALAFIR